VKTSKLIWHFPEEFPRSVAGHPLELFDEVGLIVVVVEKFPFQVLKRLPLRQFSVEPVKSKDLSQKLRGKTDMTPKEDIEVPSRISRCLLKLPNRTPAVRRSKRVQTKLYDRITARTPQHEGDQILAE
jgi:hypothetical protein